MEDGTFNWPRFALSLAHIANVGLFEAVEIVQQPDEPTVKLAYTGSKVNLKHILRKENATWDNDHWYDCVARLILYYVETEDSLDTIVTSLKRYFNRNTRQGRVVKFYKDGSLYTT